MENIIVPTAYPKCRLMETASPPVSPKVVAAILITQNARVTSGTLFLACSAISFMRVPLATCGNGRHQVVCERQLCRGRLRKDLELFFLHNANIVPMTSRGREPPAVAQRSLLRMS